MHELSVTENILEIALKHARVAEATRVTDIHLVIGRLSSIIDDSVQFYWDIISKDTLCAQSRLHFRRVPARILCLNCSEEYDINTELTPCPKCASYKIKVIAGDDFWLESIEIEK
ncbi:MAG TPA: hydrogenase maturation nickel metallochaperone HypA [Anaerolineaceae bacterium]